MNNKDSKGSPSSDDSDNEWCQSSEHSSKYSDSSSSAAEWDDQVDDTGELIYVQYKSEASSNSQSNNQGTLLSSENVFKLPNNFKRSSTRRASRGKFFKAFRNRNKGQETEKRLQDEKDRLLNCVSSEQGSQCNEIEIKVDLTRSFHSERACRLEELFGLSVSSNTDNSKLIVNNILDEAQYLYENKVANGCCLKKIDGECVTSYNINMSLDKIWQFKDNIILSFEKIHSSVGNFDLDLSKFFLSKYEHEVVLSQILRDFYTSVVFIACNKVSENSNSDDVLYCYPRPKEKNILFSAKGAYITLNHLLSKVLPGRSPCTTAAVINDISVNISYFQCDNILMLLSVPKSRHDLFSQKILTHNIVRTLEFLHENLSNCFDDGKNEKKLDLLFSRLFASIISAAASEKCKQIIKIEELMAAKSICNDDSHFEQILPMAHLLTLPRDTSTLINDVLTEFEAADYREWTDDIMNYQRLYVIVGCCLYYKSHLLCSHLQDDNLIDIQSFLRVTGLLSISCLDNINKIILWKEVYLSQYRKNKGGANQNKQEYSLPKGRWFLMIVVKEKFLLASLMEAGNCTEDPEPNPPPSAFYVEDCESYVDVLIDMGLNKFLDAWFRANTCPQVELNPENLTKVGKTLKDLFGIQKIEAFNKSSLSPVKGNKSESQSALKRRHHSTDFLNIEHGSHSFVENSSASSFNLSSTSWIQGQQSSTPRMYGFGHHQDMAYSEDSNSQRSSSENNEERVAGRRADRELTKQRRGSCHSSESDSEWDIQNESRESGSFELSDVKKSLANEIIDNTIYRITAGEDNVLFHFVQLELKRGILLAPVQLMGMKSNSTLHNYILKVFRKAAQKIHKLLQNSLRFKNVVPSSGSVSKSLVAIREHGMLLQVPNDVLTQSIGNKKTVESFKFWVVGRLYNETEPKELYLCYHESVPQDLLEVAFRLSSLK